MNLERTLDALGAAARDEPPPLVDVVDPVLRELRLSGRLRVRPMGWFAACAAAAAIVVALLAVRAVVDQQSQLLPPMDSVIAVVP